MNRALLLCLALCSATANAQAPAAPKADEKPRILVVNLAAQGVDPSEAAAMTDAVVQSLSDRKLFQVLSSRDVQAIINAERQRQLTGSCTDDMKCAADLGEATNTRFVLTGALSKLGSALELSLQTLDTIKGQPIGRSSRLANDLSTLRGLVPYAVAEATGSPLPPPRPRWLQYSMISVGAGAIIGGGVLGMLALSRESVLNDELCPQPFNASTDPSCHGTNLRPRSYYLAQADAIGSQKTVALVLIGAGAALVAGGLLLMPAPEGGPRVAFVPTPSGVAFAGVFP